MNSNNVNQINKGDVIKYRYFDQTFASEVVSIRGLTVYTKIPCKVVCTKTHLLYVSANGKSHPYNEHQTEIIW